MKGKPEPVKPEPEKVKPVSPPPKPDEVVSVDKGNLSPDGVATV